MTFGKFTNSPNSLLGSWNFTNSSNSLLDIWIILQPSTDRKTRGKPMNFYSLVGKKTLGLLVGKKLFPCIATRPHFLHGLYVTYFKTKNCYVFTKIHGVSIFVSIPHCPMDYSIPDYFK